MNRLRIKKLGVLSVAKMYAAIAFVISLLIAIPYGLFIIIFSLIGAAGAAGSSGDAAFALGGGGVMMGIFVIILIPVMYTIMAFVGGAIGALIYNLFAGMVGGIEIEVESVA